MRPEGREPLPDKAGESTLLSRSGGEKGLTHKSSPTLRSKASILQCSAFFMVQLSHPYMSTRKTIALTVRTFVGKVMSLLFNTLSRFVIFPFRLLQNTEILVGNLFLI